MIRIFIDKKAYGNLYGLIRNDKIKDENKVKEIIKVFIDKKEHGFLYALITEDKIKNENQLKQSVQIFIDKKKQSILYHLIKDDKIKTDIDSYEILTELYKPLINGIINPFIPNLKENLKN